MATTYLGRTIVTIPAFPPAPASFQATGAAAVAMSRSPFTFQQQVQDWGGSQRRFSISMPPIDYTHAQDWIAFLISLRGSSKVFQFTAAFRAAYPNDFGDTYWCLAKNDVSWSVGENRYYGFSFEIEEVL